MMHEMAEKYGGRSTHVTLFYISKVIEKKEKNLICIIYVRVY